MSTFLHKTGLKKGGGGIMIKAVLTIDDIASGNTPAIADYLNEKGIRCVMFAKPMFIGR